MPDDIVSSGGSSHPFSAERIYEGDSVSMPSGSALRAPMDAAAENGDSLTEEAMSEVMQDLEAPMRPNISSYDSGSTDFASKDRAQTDRKPTRRPIERRPMDASAELSDSLTEEMMGDGLYQSRYHGMRSLANLIIQQFYKIWKHLIDLILALMMVEQQFTTRMKPESTRNEL